MLVNPPISLSGLTTGIISLFIGFATPIVLLSTLNLLLLFSGGGLSADNDITLSPLIKTNPKDLFLSLSFFLFLALIRLYSSVSLKT